MHFKYSREKYSNGVRAEIITPKYINIYFQIRVRKLFDKDINNSIFTNNKYLKIINYPPKNPAYG